MGLGALIIFAALQAAPTAEPTDHPAQEKAANTGIRAGIFRSVRSFEESEDQSGMVPDATLELLDLARSDADRKRRWRAVPASGVISDRHLLRMTIVAISADRAILDARTRLTRYHRDAEGKSSAEKARIIHDRVELARTGAGWRIMSVARRIR